MAPALLQSVTESTVLPRLAKEECPGEYEVYRVLDEIAKHEETLQKHLYRQYLRLGLAAESTIFYDITSSYFEGGKCVLAAYGYSRDHRPNRKQIVIALVITPDGYPVYWQVMPGNVQDVTTIKELLNALKIRFGIDECLLVFDRGMVSAENLQVRKHPSRDAGPRCHRTWEFSRIRRPQCYPFRWILNDLLPHAYITLLEVEP